MFTCFLLIEYSIFYRSLLLLAEEVDRMEKTARWEKGKKRKTITVVLIMFLLIAAIGICSSILENFGAKYWPVRYKDMLDDFFGEWEWEVISKENKKESLPTTINSVDGNVTVYLTYTEWTISVLDSDGKSFEYIISNHPYKMSETGGFTAKRAFIQQLMFISQEKAVEKLRQEVLSDYLTEAEMDCMEIDFAWRNGNPSPSVYSQLLKEEWFSYDATAEDWLKTNLYDYYIRIYAHDYMVEKLSEEEQTHLLSSREQIEQALQEKYGVYADYEIYIPE